MFSFMRWGVSGYAGASTSVRQRSRSSRTHQYNTATIYAASCVVRHPPSLSAVTTLPIYATTRGQRILVQITPSCVSWKEAQPSSKSLTFRAGSVLHPPARLPRRTPSPPACATYAAVTVSTSGLAHRMPSPHPYHQSTRTCGGVGCCRVGLHRRRTRPRHPDRSRGK